MDAKQGPFSLYDFLGYFFPGAVGIFAAALFFDELGIGARPLGFLELSRFSELLPFVLAAYLLGHALSLLSSFSVERYFIWHFDYPSKSLVRMPVRGFLDKSKKFSMANVVKLVVWILLLPISVLVSLICFFSIGRPGMVSQLDPLLATIIRAKVDGLIADKGQTPRPGEVSRADESDFFRLVYHYTVENAPAHLSKMQNYVALFGFNRAVCFVFVILFWVCLVSVAFGGKAGSIQLLAASVFLSNLFFFGFAKFYRRFSLESLMALTATYSVPEELVETTPKEGKARGTVGVDIRASGVPVLNLMRDLRRRIRKGRPAL